MAGLNFEINNSSPLGNIIKVLGVGGGGSNAVSYMFEQGHQECRVCDL